MTEYRWDDPSPGLADAINRALANAGGGAPPAPFRLKLSIGGGGGFDTVDLREGANSIRCVGLLKMLPSSGPSVFVTAPTFSAGTVHIDYAELDVTNLAGTQRLFVGLDAGADLTSAQSLNVVWDDLAEGQAVGSDLVGTVGSPYVLSTAGGMFWVEAYLDLTVTGLVA